MQTYGKHPDACTWSRLNGLETAQTAVDALKMVCQGILGYDEMWREKYKANGFMPRGLYHCSVWSNDVRGVAGSIGKPLQPVNPNIYDEFAALIEAEGGLGEFSKSHRNPNSGCQIYMWTADVNKLQAWWKKTFPPVPDVIKPTLESQVTQATQAVQAPAPQLQDAIRVPDVINRPIALTAEQIGKLMWMEQAAKARPTAKEVQAIIAPVVPAPIKAKVNAGIRRRLARDAGMKVPTTRPLARRRIIGRRKV